MYGYLHPHLAASESEPADLVAKKGWFDHLHGLFGRDFAESLMKRGETIISKVESHALVILCY